MYTRLFFNQVLEIGAVRTPPASPFEQRLGNHPPRMSNKFSDRSELAAALWSMRRVFFTVGAFSLVINLLMLVPSVYMLQVYDRVLTSRSESTLIMLTLLAVGLLALMASLEWVRSRLLVRAGAALDAEMNARVFTAAFEANLRGAGANAGQAISDLTAVRQFVTGNGPFAFFDAPWFPLYLAVIFLIHPWLGFLSLAGAVVLIALAVTTQLATRGLLLQANTAAVQSANDATNNLRNAEAIEAMGMLTNLRLRWYEKYRKVIALQGVASDRAGSITSVTKFVRIAQQSLVLGLGALLAIEGQITPGGMIVASILMGRALAPVELLISTWNQFLTARSAYDRLERLLKQFPKRDEGMPLPAPRGHLVLENVIAGAPGTQAPILKGVSFAVEPGNVLGVIGPTASGKSTLARLLVGVWPAGAGTVRLDGADVFKWNKEQLGKHIGYLPQDIELFGGTIAENIARFGEIDPDQVIEAARQAGVHEMILRFPNGYDTPIGVGGSFLSGGQKQRIALARALYGAPTFLVLDEPNSNLDETGEAALVQAVQAQKAAGHTIIVITHRTSILAAVDKLLLLREGTVQAFGPRQQVLDAIARAAQTALAAGGRPPVVAAQPQRG
jgi:ATP-binding cassette subfamily C exporter for protease/lipase